MRLLNSDRCRALYNITLTCDRVNAFARLVHVARIVNHRSTRVARKPNITEALSTDGTDRIVGNTHNIRAMLQELGLEA